jgi:hypothetical protein
LLGWVTTRSRLATTIPPPTGTSRTAATGSPCGSGSVDSADGFGFVVSAGVVPDGVVSSDVVDPDGEPGVSGVSDVPPEASGSSEPQAARSGTAPTITAPHSTERRLGLLVGSSLDAESAWARTAGGVASGRRLVVMTPPM